MLGGYASVACVIGAVLWRVPIVVAEQNARAGAANRLAGRFARASAVPFPETDLPRKVLTGNPVRAEVLAIDRVGGRAAAREALGLPLDRTVVAVVTGSLGARKVNQAVRAAVPTWADRSDLAVRHVIGSRDFEAMAIGQMLQPMFDTMEADPMFGGGAGEEAFKGLLVQEYGRLVAARGGIGLAGSLAGLLGVQEAAR